MHEALDRLIWDHRIPYCIIPDNTPELVAGEFKRKALRYGTSFKLVEAWTPNQNLAESAIQEIKRSYRWAMWKSNAPGILWDHCLELIAELRSNMVLNLSSLGGDSPHTKLTGNTADISHLVEFEWYQMVWYSNPGMEGRKLR